MKHHLLGIALLAVTALVVSACQGASPTPTPQVSPSPSPSPTTTPEPATPTPAATPTPFPTLTPAPTPTSTPRPTATPVPSPTPTLAPAPTPTLEPLPELAPYEDTTFGFSIDYPETWDAFVGDITQGNTLFLAQGELGVPRVLVNFGFASELGGVEVQAAQVLEGLQDLFEEEIEVFSEGAVELNDGTMAYEYNLTLPFTDVALGTKLVIISTGSRVYQVFAQTVTGDFEGRLPELEAIAKTFRLQEPAPFGVTRQQALTLLQGGPSSLDPHLIGDADSYIYVVQIFSGLVTLDGELNVVPDLAERWEELDGGTTYVFHLRRDARFHDGRQVTAQDVKFSIERAADLRTGSQTARIYLNDIVGFIDKLAGTANQVSGVEVIDAFTLRIRIKQPVPYFLAKLTHPAAFVVDQENVEASTFWYLEPNGTGPFKLMGWDPGIVLVLERNDDYYRGPAQVPYVLAWNIGGNALTMYEAGELDVAQIILSDVEEVQAPEGPFSDQLQVTPELTVFYTGFNRRVAPFDDLRARRAFAMAVDLDTIITEELFGGYRRATGFMPLGLPGYNPDLQPLPFDAAQASALWQEVVVEKGLEENAQVTMVLGGTFVPSTLVRMAEMWEENLGVTIRFLLADVVDLGSALEQNQANLFNFGWVADYPDPQNFLDVLFHSQAVINYGLYANTEVDGLLEQARVEADRDARLQLYRDAESLMVQDVAAIPMWFTSAYTLVSPDVADWSLSAQSVPDLVNVRLLRPIPPRPTPTPEPPDTATI